MYLNFSLRQGYAKNTQENRQKDIIQINKIDLENAFNKNLDIS